MAFNHQNTITNAVKINSNFNNDKINIDNNSNINNNGINNNNLNVSTTTITKNYNSNVNSLMTNVSSNNNNNSTTTTSIYPSSVLCDISNLTAEERKKLDEIRTKRNKLLNEIQKLKEEIGFVKKEMSRLNYHHHPQHHSSIDGSSFEIVGSITGGSATSSIVTNSSQNSHSNGNLNPQRLKQLTIGKKKFNIDHKKGIEFLVMNNLIQNTPEDVAKFLYKGEGLNKTAIGAYLGEKIDFNLAVLDNFIELHDFHDLLLVQALRQFLWSFRLPGEAQKIDRMMEKFAAHYCEQNPNVFSNTDTCFVLSFSVIMLNTSLHNPNVKEKMTAERFIQMNRGINNGGDLPKELLLSLYENIRQEPFKIPEDDGNDLMHTFFNPDREGWLWKQGGRYKNWKRRWFLLNDKCLYYFECSTDKEPRGIIPLENVDIREISDRGGRQHCFEVFSPISDVIKACKTDTEGRVIEGRHSVYRLSASTADEKDAWVKSIRTSVSHNPFYEMLAARKRKAQQN
ncbi:epididymal secretory protein E1-like [Sarcoptes scabiei]|nr:epididymal secretory protein E1-like [Sarcoptes scabiei]